MTTVTFYRSDDTVWGFSSVGHSGYAEEGGDIICAAISSMSLLVVNAIEEGYGAPVRYAADPDIPRLSVAVPSLVGGGLAETVRFAVHGLFHAYRRQLIELAGDYPEYIRVVTEEKDP